MSENEKIDNISEEEALFLIFITLHHIASKDAIEQWSDFCEEIKYNRRFFPQAKLLNSLERLKENATVTLDKGTLYYRARLIEGSFLDIDNNKKEREIILTAANKCFDDVDFSDVSQLDDLLALDYYALFNEKFKTKYFNTLNEPKQWWGYDEKGSDAPPKDVARAGRGNSKLISYLYLASDEKTAIAEVRPMVNQEVSVAEIRLSADLKIFDLIVLSSNDSAKEMGEHTDFFLMEKIATLFSNVNYGSEDDYIPTQYISDYIRNMGYDGIKYKSSINPEGHIIILFDTNPDTNDSENEDRNFVSKKYEIENSRVVGIQKYEIQYQQIAPFYPIDES